MKVLIQWALGHASDWEEFDSSEWAALPRKAAPAASRSLRTSDSLDDQRGWVSAVNVQGVVFEGDAITLEDQPNGSVVVWQINEDPRDWAPDKRYARRIVIPPLAPDPRFGNAYNTRFDVTTYGGIEGAEDWNVAEVLMPSSALRLSGIWLPDTLYQDNLRARAARGWREWTAGVPTSLIKNEQVVSGRKVGRYSRPDGTRTYYLTTADRPTGVHTVDYEKALNTSSGTSGLITVLDVDSSGKLIITGTTDTTEPDHAQWPAGNYRFQIDCKSVNSDVTYGLLDLGAGPGHFGRVNAALSSDLETKSQVESAFQYSGLKIATTGSTTWTSGADTDRFEVALAADRPYGHGTGDISLELGESDDFADGPWTEAGTTASSALFFGGGF